MTKLARAVVATLLSIAVVTAVRAGGPDCLRVVAVGDLHGGYEVFESILRETGVVDGSGRWADPGACLVQLGDVVDRGGKPRAVLDLLMDLTRQAPGRVEMLLGNHEVMVLVGDLRYTNRVEFEAFAGEESPEEREAAFREFRRSVLDGGAESTARAEFEARFPRGWFAHRRAFSPSGRYGAWLLQRPSLLRIDRTLFVHGGVSEAWADRGIDAINATIEGEILEYVTLRDRLEKEGMLDPFLGFGEAFEAVRSRLQASVSAPGGIPEGERERVEDAVAFMSLLQALAWSPNGPLWNRAFSGQDEAKLTEWVPRVLTRLGAERVVVGHTTNDDGRIRSRLGGWIYAIDTGAGPAYDGSASALEIDWAGRVRAVYPGAAETLADPPLDDEEVERLLGEGAPISSEEIGAGSTGARKIRLRLGDRTIGAAFKFVHIHRGRIPRAGDPGRNVVFSDTYQNERAAYLVDRLLGLGMVPQVVVRAIEGQRGALVAWIPDALTESEVRKQGLSPKDPRVLGHQEDVMRTFDALIGNVDRNLGNQLITTGDWKLHLIDHSRSFVLDRELDEEFRKRPSSLPRSLLERLEALDEPTLRARLDGLVGRAQIRAMLARRDAILAKVEEDRRRYGDALVFHELAPPLP